MQDAGRMREILCFAFALYVFFGLKSLSQTYAAPTSWNIHYTISQDAVTAPLDNYIRRAGNTEDSTDWARVMGTEP